MLFQQKIDIQIQYNKYQNKGNPIGEVFSNKYYNKYGKSDYNLRTY